MTTDDFRRMALSFPDTIESAHMNHPDFRANGKIFATLPNPDNGYAMVKLPPEDQAAFVELDPSAFQPVKGGWGRQGATNVHLKVVKEETLGEALTIAWQNVSRKVPRKVSSKKSR